MKKPNKGWRPQGWQNPGEYGYAKHEADIFEQGAEAMLEACHLHYEAENKKVVGEIFEEIEGESKTLFNSYYDIKIITPRYQALKSRFLEGQ